MPNNRSWTLPLPARELSRFIGLWGWPISMQSEAFTEALRERFVSVARPG